MEQLDLVTSLWPLADTATTIHRSEVKEPEPPLDSDEQELLKEMEELRVEERKQSLWVEIKRRKARITALTLEAGPPMVA